MTIGIATAMLGAGTFAYFSDVETSTGNTFTAGTINMVMNGVDPWTGPVVTNELTDLKPCETGLVVITLENDGQNPVDVWKHIFDVDCTENGVNEPEQAWYDANGIIAPGQNWIDTVILYDMWIDKDGNPAEYDPAVDEMIVDESEGLHIDDITCFWIYIGVLGVGETWTIVQSYHMEADTENWAQSDMMTFSIEFFGQQTTGNPGPPGPELSNHGKP